MQRQVKKGINVFGLRDDKKLYQGLRGLCLGRGRMRFVNIFQLVLELLSACGMILRARLLTSPTDGRCRPLLNFRVHYSFVINRNVLNLSEGSRV